MIITDAVIPAVSNGEVDGNVYLKDTDTLDDISNGSTYVRYAKTEYDLINSFYGMIIGALSDAGMANREIKKTLLKRLQTGLSVIYNRGVIAGCAGSAKGSDSKLTIASGKIYAHGRIIAHDGDELVIPANSSGSAKDCYAYIDNSDTLQITTLDSTVPETGITLTKISVPDSGPVADLSDCTITDQRTVETDYPQYITTAPYINVSLPYDTINTTYKIYLDIVSYEGNGFAQGRIYIGDRASNGFKIYSNGAIDAVTVRWLLIKEEL